MKYFALMVLIAFIGQLVYMLYMIENPKEITRVESTSVSPWPTEVPADTEPTPTTSHIIRRQNIVEPTITPTAFYVNCEVKKGEYKNVQSEGECRNIQQAYINDLWKNAYTTTDEDRKIREDYIKAFTNSYPTPVLPTGYDFGGVTLTPIPQPSYSQINQCYQGNTSGCSAAELDRIQRAKKQGWVWPPTWYK